MREKLKFKIFKAQYIIVLIGFLCIPNSALAQPKIDVSRAVYAKVIDHWSQFNNNPDTLLLEDASDFQKGDTVLFYHTISGYAYDSTDQLGEIRDFQNAGVYGIFLIDDVIGNRIALNNRLPWNGSYNHRDGDFGQLIKVPTYERARLTGDFVFPEWDANTKTGGIFPILVNRKLIIEDDVSADGKGFSGGKLEGEYVVSGGVCSEGIMIPDTSSYHFLATDVDSAANKGETFSNNKGNKLADKVRGRGFIGTAGGGGNALYSGGGGGAGFGRGGNGGLESDSCANPGTTMGGLGGQSVTASTDPENDFGNRIFIGGGGGAANQDPSLGRPGTAGGNGGGIFIIITDTLELRGNHTVSANGETIQDTAVAGGGGGGGGGVIIIDVNTYFGDDLNLETKGGDGGYVTGETHITGPGGGGGGGLIHFPQAFPGTLFSLNTSKGSAGSVNSIDDFNGASDGANGSFQGNLKIPILGFLFNVIPDDQTICQDEMPPLLDAGSAKGGSGNFSYLWYQSSDTVTANFVPASVIEGPNNLQSYQPPMLDDTTYYKRYVEDNVNTNILSFSFYMVMNVNPAIQGNYITDDDTVCFNSSPLMPLSSDSTLRGGNEKGFSYQWEKSELDFDSWGNALGVDDQADYSVPEIGITSNYRRLVTSGACEKYSDTVSITVLPSITNNTIAEDQILCNLVDISPLDGEEIQNGDTNDKRYQWWQIQNDTWQEQVATEDYDPPGLTAGNYEFRRIAFSGSDDACIDTSAAVSVIVYPDIVGNVISSVIDTICAELPSITIDGSNSGFGLEGGSGEYAYFWEESPDGTGSWSPQTGENGNDKNDFQPGSLSATKWYKRTVYSAISDSACVDVSSVLKIEVLPVLVNNIISSNETICQFTRAAQIDAGPATGGLNEDYKYFWEIRENNSDWRSTGETGLNINPGILSDSSFFRRVIESGPGSTCTDISDSVIVFVQPAINLNEFESLAFVDTCYASEVKLETKIFEGGDGSHGYIWQDSTRTRSAWMNSDGVNDLQNYTIESLVDTTWYRRIAFSGACRDTSEVKILNAEPLPELLGVSESEPIICTQDELYLLMNMKEKNTKLYVSYTDNNEGVFNDIFVDNDKLQLETLNDGFYEYNINEIKDQNGCLSVNNGSPVNVRIDKSLVARINEPDLYELCDFNLELSTTLDDASLGDYSTVWEVLNSDTLSILSSTENNAIIEPISSISSNFSLLKSKVIFAQNTVACPGIKDTIDIVLYRPLEDINITIPESKVMYFRDWDIISVIPDTIGVHNWKLNDFANDNNASIHTQGTNPVRIEDIPLTEYSLSGDIENTTVLNYTLTNGVCTPRSFDVEIIRNEVKIYDGISPEQTPGENDYLIAEGLNVESISSFSFQIFSTNGMMVREITQDDVNDIVVLNTPSEMDNDAMVIWDGKNKNGDRYVTPGTYYYVLVLTFKEQEFIDKGFVVVK